jgi:hypothetical protein
MKTMKVTILIVFAFIHFSGFSQSLEEREKITAEFEKRSDVKIELFNIKSISKHLDSIKLKSDFLKKKNIDFKIIGFRISGVDKNGKTIYIYLNQQQIILFQKNLAIK